MNNASMFTADRATHLKIVVVSLVCATVVAGIGVAARVSDVSTNDRLEATVMKAGAPVTSPGSRGGGAWLKPACHGAKGPNRFRTR